MLSTEHMQRIKATVPLLASHGPVLAQHFYDRLFEHQPELRGMFNRSNQADGSQARALARAILAYASNLDRLEALAPAIERITLKHAGVGVLPEHYPVVGKHLLASMREVLGAAADEATLEAWQAAYEQLATVFIAAEKKLGEPSDEVCEVNPS